MCMRVWRSGRCPRWVEREYCSSFTSGRLRCGVWVQRMLASVFADRGYVAVINARRLR